MKKQIVFKAVVYRDASDPMTGEISKQPFSVTLYSDRSFVTRWCGQFVEKRTAYLDDYGPEERVLAPIKDYLREEIKKLPEMIECE